VPGIIWLASYPKSGNTWLRAFLANYLTDPAEPVAINDLPTHVVGDNLVLHYEKLTGKSAAELTEADFARLRPRVHEWFARSRPQDVFVKTHNTVRKMDGVPLITPSATAAAVYVLRNPLDVAVSFAHHYQVTYARAVDSLCSDDYVLPSSNGLLPQYLGSWSRHVESWTGAPGFTLHVLRYEDMQADPVRAFGRLVRFLGMPKDRVRLKKAIQFSAFRELSGQERSARFVESRPDGKSAFFRAGRSGAWQRILTEKQAETLADKHQDAMIRMGYLTENGELAR
jgi:hypothetical protein